MIAEQQKRAQWKLETGNLWWCIFIVGVGFQQQAQVSRFWPFGMIQAWLARKASAVRDLSPWSLVLVCVSVLSVERKCEWSGWKGRKAVTRVVKDKVQWEDYSDQEFVRQMLRDVLL